MKMQPCLSAEWFAFTTLHQWHNKKFMTTLASNSYQKATTKNHRGSFVKSHKSKNATRLVNISWCFFFLLVFLPLLLLALSKLPLAHHLYTENHSSPHVNIINKFASTLFKLLKLVRPFKFTPLYKFSSIFHSAFHSAHQSTTAASQPKNISGSGRRAGWLAGNSIITSQQANDHDKHTHTWRVFFTINLALFKCRCREFAGSVSCNMMRRWDIADARHCLLVCLVFFFFKFNQVCFPPVDGKLSQKCSRDKKACFPSTENDEWFNMQFTQTWQPGSSISSSGSSGNGGGGDGGVSIQSYYHGCLAVGYHTHHHCVITIIVLAATSLPGLV